MQVNINANPQTNSNGNTIVDGNKGDITVSNNGQTWTLNSAAINNLFVTEISTSLSGTNNYTTTNNFQSETLKVYINGLIQSKNLDYVTTSSNAIQFFNLLETNDTVLINYIKI